MSPRKKRWLILWAMALVLGALGAYGAVTALRFISTYQQVVEAKDLLLAVDASLGEEGLGASAATLAGARAQAMRARDRFRSAHGFLAGEPLLQTMQWVPGLGDQISAARELAGIGYEASEIGLSAMAALETFNTMCPAIGKRRKAAVAVASRVSPPATATLPKARCMAVNALLSARNKNRRRQVADSTEVRGRASPCCLGQPSILRPGRPYGWMTADSKLRGGACQGNGSLFTTLSRSVERFLPRPAGQRPAPMAARNR